MNFYSVETSLYSECKLPEDIFIKLKETIAREENNKIKINNFSSGNIENQYKIIKPDIDFLNFIEKRATEFHIKNKIEYSDVEKSGVELKINSLWINKQKKYEFNPVHSHNGTVSFVCWVQIPYNLKDELNLNNCKNANSKMNSLFSLTYINYFGCLCHRSIMVDKNYEGICLFFDSRLYHQVYPFYTSDDYRISVSGNFTIKPNAHKKISYS
jgi:hypothetical protein